MERLTWDGMATHGGNNPGKPSSHGCIHVPLGFAEKLHGITQKGDMVLISDLQEVPSDIVNPSLLQQQTPEPAPDPKRNVKVPRGGAAPATFPQRPPRSRQLHPPLPSPPRPPPKRAVEMVEIKRTFFVHPRNQLEVSSGRPDSS